MGQFIFALVMMAVVFGWRYILMFVGVITGDKNVIYEFGDCIHKDRRRVDLDTRNLLAKEFKTWRSDGFKADKDAP